MVASASTNMRNPVKDRIPQGVHGRSSSRSSFHCSRSRRVHQGHPTGKTSPKYHVGSSRKVIAREETGAHSSMMDHHPPRQLQLVKELDLRPTVNAEVRGARTVTEESDAAGEVEMRQGRENHRPETRVLKTVLVHHVFNLHVLSSKMIAGKFPKLEMWLLDIMSTAEMPCSIHPAQNARSLSGCCQIHVEHHLITRVENAQVSRTTGEVNLQWQRW